ncbi:asparagine synthetase B family protein [Halorussus ruber]|uniref:hypothetical protein n=1 Tax=Halorussus ruber TaxID=1126238 RepID=UPI001092A5B4|nr:hypothetical protein [Halorussus ruber]
MIPPRQYYLTSTRPEEIPDGYRSVSVDDWHLVFDDSFDSLPVVADGERVGHVVGTILDVRDRREDGELRLSPGDADSLDAAFQDALVDFAGHFLGLLDANQSSAYTDPIGGCPLVYDPDEGVAGATPAALPGIDREARFQTALFDRLNHNEDYIFLPGAVTYYRNVERLLPNHRLDLDSWETTRFWPSDPEAISTYDETTAVAESMSQLLRDVFAEIAATYENPVNPLTAGQDSRTLLAAARPWVADGDIQTVTWDTGELVDVDMDVARRLSANHEVDWNPVPTVTATEAQKRWWLETTGHAVGGTIKDIHPTLELFDADLHVNGFGGAIARGKFWEDADGPDSTFDAGELLARLHRPEDPVLEEAVEEWYEGVSQFDAYTQLDLVTQELRYGCWAGPHFPGLARHRDVVSPLAYFPVVREMFRLAPPVRRNGNVQHLIVDRLWSELNEYPYNMFTDWREFVRRAKHLKYKSQYAAKRPDLVYSFLSRKLTGE